MPQGFGFKSRVLAELEEQELLLKETIEAFITHLDGNQKEIFQEVHYSLAE